MSLKPPEEHLGHLVLRENKPIRLARIPVNGDSWQDSVILHPRYVQGGVDHEIFIARVYRRGRTLDLFLDEPVVVDGAEYGILNFKGVGAKADRPLVIQPDDWWHKLSGGWVPRKIGDKYERVWGAVRKGEARQEFPAKLFHRYDIYHAPHLALNEIPKEVTRYIKRSVHGTERHNLVQLVRGLQTNIRCGDYELLTPEQEETVDISRIAKEDANLINTQFALARKGKMLRFIGQLAENRYIDGRYTDAENLYTGELKWWDAVHFLDDVATHFARNNNSYDRRWKYYKELEKETKLPFLSIDRPWNSSRKLLMEELSRVTEGKYGRYYI